ncbi:MAG: hypothetical protein IKO41_13375 [Lachnospiraceae bacterium]|nr:hypothetical protein [Lachnospiraceae bacterium]
MNEDVVETLGEQGEIRKEVFAICCPFCGKYHYKMLEGHGMFTCEKCRRNVEVIVRDGRMTLFAEKSLEMARRRAVACSDGARMTAKRASGDAGKARGRSLGHFSGCMG